MKTYLGYGAAMALAGLVLNVLLYLTGFHSDPTKIATAQIVGPLLGVGISITCVILAIRARRSRLPATEEFSYGDALGAGVMVGVFAALISPFTTYLYAGVINPDFVEAVVQLEIQKLEAKGGLSSAQLEGAEKMMRNFAGATAQAVLACIGTFIFALVISLIAAAFLKRAAAPETFIAPPPLA